MLIYPSAAIREMRNFMLTALWMERGRVWERGFWIPFDLAHKAGERFQWKPPQEERGSVMNVKVRKGHHVDILSWREGWCCRRSQGNLTSSTYTVTILSSFRSKWIIIVLKCLSDVTIPPLPISRTLFWCQCVHWKTFTRPDPLQLGKIIWSCPSQWNSSKDLVGVGGFWASNYIPVQKGPFQLTSNFALTPFPSFLASAMNTETVSGGKVILHDEDKNHTPMEVGARW